MIFRLLMLFVGVFTSAYGVANFTEVGAQTFNISLMFGGALFVLCAFILQRQARLQDEETERGNRKRTAIREARRRSMTATYDTNYSATQSNWLAVDLLNSVNTVQETPQPYGESFGDSFGNYGSYNQYDSGSSYSSSDSSSDSGSSSCD